jgi:fibronectin type 3 domain-containing protein
MRRIFWIGFVAMCLACPGYAEVKDVTLQWEHSIDLPYLEWYKVYYYTIPGDKDSITINKSNTQITLSLDNIKTYYFVVTAIDTRGLESAPSNEVSTLFWPGAPKNIRLVP